jgi:hypothetical protein
LKEELQKAKQKSSQWNLGNELRKRQVVLARYLAKGTESASISTKTCAPPRVHLRYIEPTNKRLLT